MNHTVFFGVVVFMASWEDAGQETQKGDWVGRGNKKDRYVVITYKLLAWNDHSPSKRDLAHAVGFLASQSLD